MVASGLPPFRDVQRRHRLRIHLKWRRSARKDIFEGARVRWDASLPDDEGISTARLDNMKDCDAETLLNAVPEWDLHRMSAVPIPPFHI